MTAPAYFVGPNEKQPRSYTQSERLKHALRNIRAAQTHIRFAGMPWHQPVGDMAKLLAGAFRGLHSEEQAICAALELAIDAEAKKARAK